jgi:hypothetical protein
MSGAPEVTLAPHLVERATTVFSLTSFPFPTDELNPLEDPGDMNRVSWVDGWVSAQNLESTVAERARQGKPCLIVISGGSGTGRSSLVNYFVHLWGANRSGESTRPLVVSFRAWTNNGGAGLMEWADPIEALVEEAGIPLSDVTRDAFAALRAETPAQIAGALRNLLRRVVGDLKAPSAKTTLVGVVEEIKDKSYLEEAVKLLPTVDALLIMTVDATKGTGQTVLDNADALLQPVGELVRLTPLSGEESKTVVQERWQRSAGDLESPWSEGGLVRAFEAHQRPLRDVISLMAGLLAYEGMHADETERWPESSRLRLDDETLCDRLRVLDGLLARHA